MRCDCTVDTSHVKKSIHLHVTATKVTSKLMEGRSWRHMLKSSIARLHGSPLAINRTSAREVLRVFCLIEM